MPNSSRILPPLLNGPVTSGAGRLGGLSAPAVASRVGQGTSGVLAPDDGVATSPGQARASSGSLGAAAARTAADAKVQASTERALRFYGTGLAAKRRASLAIEEQTSIVGAQADIRTTTIAERFHPPRAKEARDHALSTRNRALRAICALRLNLEGLLFPGFALWETDASGHPRPKYQGSPPGSMGPIVRGSVPAEMLPQALDNEPPHPDWDDAVYLSDAIAILDGTVAALRVVEGRVQEYKRFISICQQALSSLQQREQQAATDLEHTSVKLAEVRHDVAVLSALLTEEQERVNQLNQRRQQTLIEHVSYLAYCRPRYLDNTQPLPIAELSAERPAQIDLASLETPSAIPDVVRAVVELIREAPLRWLREPERWVRSFVDREALVFSLEYATKRAGSRELSGYLSRRIAQAQSPLGNFIGRSYATQYRGVQAYRQRTSQLATEDLRTLALSDGRTLAPDVLSLGDLIDGAHGELHLAASASALLEHLQAAIAHLYNGFKLVPPALRLHWTGGLSQYDQAVDLSDLATLPGWATVDATNRSRLQQLVQLLYNAINAEQPEALLLMHDVVRMCILLASHAPVSAILDGQIEQQQAVQRDSRLRVRIGTGSPRVGMRVLITPPSSIGGSARQLHAVVEDLLLEHAIVRVLSSVEHAETLTPQHRVDILAAE